MDEVTQEYINAWAKEKTIYQIVIGLLVALAIISWMAKHFKIIADGMPSFIKFLKWVHRKTFGRAILEHDIKEKLEAIQLQGNVNNKKIEAVEHLVSDIREEVKYNGGSVRMVDALKKVEKSLQHVKSLRDISDKYDEKMNFRLDPERGITFISESFLARFGCREGQVLTYAWIDLIHPEDRAEALAKWKVAVETQTSFSDRQRIRDGIGDYQECEVKAEPITFGGEILEFKGVIDLVF